jgi:hypothetical protein
MYHEAIEKVSKQVLIRDRYDNFTGGTWVAPVEGRYFDNPSPITGKKLCAVPRCSAADIELALDAAHKAKEAWGKTSVTERSRILNRIADKLESNLDLLALVETLDNGKPIRETTYADMPLVVDHWRYFASVVRAQEGGISEIDSETVAYHYHEPLGVVGQIIPWNFPVLMATWKLAPALAAGNCVVLKPRRTDPARHPRGDGVDRRHPATGCHQRRQRFRGRGRQAAGAEQADRQDRLHRRDHDGAADHAIRLRQHHPGHARARRQVAEHLLRRCRRCG